VDRIICLDPSFTIERLLRREHPTLPVRLDLHIKDIHPKILYHYTHIAFLDDVIRCGICPGGLRTSKAHSYFSAFDPWSIQKTSQAGMASTRPVAVAVDVEMAVSYGIRFAVTQSQAVVTTDWVPNQFLIYAYDVSAKCFIYANHDYAKERASFNQDLRDIVVRRRERLDRGDEADDNARRQSLLARSRWDLFGKYEKWVHGAWVENAFILESYNREFCKDQLEHADANIGTYSTPYMAIAWQPEGDAPNNSAWPLSLGSVDWAHWTPEMEMRYDPRGNEKFFTSRWITVRQHDVEPQHCIDCGSDSPFGCLSCLNCGRLARVATDMRKASLLVRLENLAASFGFDLSLDMFPDDDIRARGDRGLRNPAGGRIRTGQSAIATIRAHAKSHMDKASKLEFGSLTER
ncbi:Zinc finger CCCH domain-containing protein 55, partial [Durusdinium trenchii]